MRLARAFDRAGDAHEAVMARLLTPIAKFWICKRGSHFAQEAMECLGGNGYVEEGGEGIMARIYREMPLNSIWEGAGNIMALDLLRALRKADAGAALAQELAPAQGAHPALDRLVAALPARVEEMATEARGAPPGAGRRAGGAGRAAVPDRAGRRVRRLLRFAAGAATGARPSARWPRAPISTPSLRAPCRADAPKDMHHARPDPAPLPQLAVLREDRA